MQILSFVMDLLDERMAQYSVFSVTMSVDKQIIISGIVCTVLPAKSDSDFLLCLQSNALIIDRSLVYLSYP